MKQQIFFQKLIRLGLILSLIIFAGCAAKKGGIKESAPEKSISDEKPSPYYFYLNSQIHLKAGRFEEAEEDLRKALLLDEDSRTLVLELARVLMLEKKTEDARLMVDRLLGNHPGDEEGLMLKARLLQDMDQVGEAAAAYEELLRQNPELERIYLLLGRIYMGKSRLEDAQRVFEALTKRFPRSYPGHFFLGRIHLLKNRADQARKEFEITLEIEPSLEEPRFELAGLLVQSGEPSKAIRIYEELLAKNPNNVRAILEMSVLLLQTGEKEKAVSLLKNLGANPSLLDEVARLLFQLYLDTENFETASVLIGHMLEENPENDTLNYLAGMANDGLENRDQALFYYEKVSPASRFYENAVVHTAFMYQEKGDIQKGLGILQQAIAAFPDNSQLYLYMGTFYEELGDWRSSLTALNQGLEIDPNNAKILFRLGVVYDKSGDKEASIRAMRSLIQIEPDNANALNYLGYTFADLGRNLDEAEKLIKKALEHKPDDGYITDSLGWVYYRMGLYEKAIVFLIKAIMLVPDDPTILEHLGDVYLKMDQAANALLYYEKSKKHREQENREALEGDMGTIERKIREIKEKMDNAP